MKKLNTLAKIFCIGLAAVSAACSDDNADVVPVPVKTAVTVNLPEGVTGLTDVTVSCTNVTTRATTTFTDPAAVELIPGLYDISLAAKTMLHDNVEARVSASLRSVEVKEDSRIVLDAFVNLEADDLIISEIFFAGTLNDSGNQYFGDDYIKLYNNTDHVVYADGLVFFQAAFLSVTKYDYTPDLMATDVAVNAIYCIPGSGTDYPVQPGETVTLADDAIDHRVLNPNSFDMSHADFEWYDETTNPNYTDVDNEAVTNLDKWYCYTQTLFSLHNRGFQGYGVARVPIDWLEYLDQYVYEYTYEMVLPVGTYEMSGVCYRMPNEWIVDYVNLSVDQMFAWTTSAPSVDMGWTGCGTIDRDPERYFKSVRRKYLYTTDDGSVVLQDTNNSTDDFNRSVTASEIELQGTATGIDGSKATVVTIDGVTPVK